MNVFYEWQCHRSLTWKCPRRTSRGSASGTGWALPSSASPCPPCTSYCTSTRNMVRHPVRVAGVGALPPPNGHVGGEYALLGEPWGVGWEGCADEEILLSRRGLSSPTPSSPRSTSPAKPPPRRETQSPCPPPPPPQTHATQKAPPYEAQVLRIGQQLIVGLGTPPWPWQGGEGEAAPAAKAARGTPLFGGG